VTGHRHLTAAVGLVLVLGVAGCDGSPAGPTAPVTVTLAPAESLLVEQTRLLFVRVVVDDRCPLDANCIRQGDAIVEVDLTVEGHRVTRELAVNDRASSATSHRGVVVTLERVDPYPAASAPADPDDYRATFEIASE